MRMFVHRREVVAEVLRWGVRLSPYPIPAFIEDVGADLAAFFEDRMGWKDTSCPIDSDTLGELLLQFTELNPSIRNWGTPKNSVRQEVIFQTDDQNPDNNSVSLPELVEKVVATMIVDCTCELLYRP